MRIKFKNFNLFLKKTMKKIISALLISLLVLTSKTTYAQRPETSVKFSYYNPSKGGINCDGECKYTASGIKILNEKNEPTGEYWWNGEMGGVACPKNYPFGTIFEVHFPDNTTGVFVCIDRGGKVKTYDGIVRLDVLSLRPPRTSGGYKFLGQTFYAQVKYPQK